jgi:uncharacterized membrane protein
VIEDQRRGEKAARAALLLIFVGSIVVPLVVYDYAARWHIHLNPVIAGLFMLAVVLGGAILVYILLSRKPS